MVKKYYKFILIFIFGLFIFIPKDTFALTTYTERFYDQEFDVSQATNYWQVITSTFNNNWANGGGGYIRFNFSITKTYGNSTSMTLAPAAVIVQNKLGNEFICDIGSVSVNNSTWNTQTYSAVCPVQFYNGAGLDKIVINFLRGSGDNSTYHGWFDGRVTFEVPQFINVPDTSANDNNNTNRVIAEQQKILQEQQKTTQAIQGNTQATKDVEDTIKSDDVDDSNAQSMFDDTDDYSNSPISDMLTMPISLLQNMLNGINGTCNPVNLGRFGFANTDFVLPCIHPENFLGSTLWGVIDALFSLFMIYNIAMLFISYYDMILTLGDPFTYLYYKTPIGYEMGGRND